MWQRHWLGAGLQRAWPVVVSRETEGDENERTGGQGGTRRGREREREGGVRGIGRGREREGKRGVRGIGRERKGGRMSRQNREREGEGVREGEGE